jgi:catechol 2,3-dioxygenase-like lactoylglutathione lyase family enzyme
MAHLAFGGKGHRIELFEYRSPRGGRVAPRPADVGFAHVCVTCDDLDAMLARLVAAGGRALSEPVTVDTGANAGGRAVYVCDPDGHTVELFTPPSA